MLGLYAKKLPQSVSVPKIIAPWLCLEQASENAHSWGTTLYIGRSQGVKGEGSFAYSLKVRGT
jgi:hypothetical protein